MLDLIKRSLFKICNDQGDELSVAENNKNEFSLEFTSLGSLWLLRYDCIVAAEYPQMALTLIPESRTFSLKIFSGSEE